MINAKDFTLTARSFVGIPYRHQGRSRAGVDCWGLLYAVTDELGILPERLTAPSDYGKMTDSAMKAQVAQYLKPVKPPEASDGRIALLKWPGLPFAGHMGILTSDGTIIHAYSLEARVVEHGWRGRWVKMTDSVWELPELAQHG